MATKKRPPKLTPEQHEKQWEALRQAMGEYKAAAIPDGYQDQSDDIVGFWVPESGLPVHGTVLGACLFDQTIEPQKSSGIIILTLLSPCTVWSKEENGPVLCNVGDRVGVFAKPGMRAIKRAQGQGVWMRLTGEVDTGKPNPMKTFDVLYPSRTKDIEIIRDDRKESKGAKFWLAAGYQETKDGTLDTETGEVQRDF